jgi:triosephosphate isomerase
MTPPFGAPVFEIGPKNLLRRSVIERIVVAAGQAAEDYGVTVLVTVPTALVAPVRELGTAVSVLAQGMSSEGIGPTMNRVTAESLADAGAHGVMVNHDADPLDERTLRLVLDRARTTGLHTVVCAGTEAEACRAAGIGTDAVLLEPPDLIGTDTSAPRDWVAPSTSAVKSVDPDVLVLHAGGVSTPAVAEAVMASGADGTGATSGVVLATDPAAAARSFIAATRAGWDRAHP